MKVNKSSTRKDMTKMAKFIFGCIVLGFSTTPISIWWGGEWWVEMLTILPALIGIEIYMFMRGYEKLNDNTLYEMEQYDATDVNNLVFLLSININQLESDAEQNCKR